MDSVEVSEAGGKEPGEKLCRNSLGGVIRPALPQWCY